MFIKNGRNFSVNFRKKTYGNFCSLDRALSFDRLFNNPIILTRVTDSYTSKNEKTKTVVLFVGH